TAAFQPDAATHSCARGRLSLAMPYTASARPLGWKSRSTPRPLLLTPLAVSCTGAPLQAPFTQSAVHRSGRGVATLTNARKSGGCAATRTTQGGSRLLASEDVGDQSNVL